MSDTPRTDAEGLATGYAKGHGFVSMTFARQLERELESCKRSISRNGDKAIDYFKDAERYRMLRFLLCEDDNDRWPALGSTELQLDDEVDQEIRDAKGKKAKS